MGDHRCCFHPREVVIGICAFCLNERLLALAAQQEELHQSSNNTHRIHSFARSRRNPINLPKTFALGSLLNRLDLRQRRPDDDQFSGNSGSQEDSFISINFGDHGAASWEKSSALSKRVALEQYNNTNMSLKQRMNKEVDQMKRAKAVIEHPKPHGSIRWRKRIGHIFQLIRWKKESSHGRSSGSKGISLCHVGKSLERLKVRHGWIRTLTQRRRTKE